MLSDNINKRLEEATSEALIQLPRVLRDADHVRGRAGQLRTEVRNFYARLTEMEAQLADSMVAVRRLDELKQRMQQCSKALDQVDTFESMFASMEQLFESLDLRRIAQHVAVLKGSSRILRSVPRLADKEELVRTYEQRLEALARPRLLAALRAQDTLQATELIAIFGELGARPLDVFLEAEAAAVAAEWPVALSPATLAAAYEALLTRVRAAAWLAPLLPGVSVGLRLAHHCLQAAAPLLHGQLGAPAVATLIVLRQAEASFVARLAALLAPADAAALADLERLAAAPFESALRQLPALLARELAEVARALRPPPAPADFFPSLETAARRLWAALQEASEQCQALAQPAVALLAAADGAVAQLLDAYTAELRVMRPRLRTDTQWANVQAAMGLLQALQLFGQQQATWLDSVRQAYGEAARLPRAEAKAGELRAELETFVLGVLLMPIEASLGTVRELKEWTQRRSTREELPSFSQQPLTYINQAGEYLITLPQHLAPYDAELLADVSSQWLSRVAAAAMHRYCEQLLRIPLLTQDGARQALVDIAYFSNVLAAFGVEPSPLLLRLKDFLAASPDPVPLHTFKP